MAEKRKVIIDVNTGDAVKDVDKLKDSIVDVGTSAEETGKKGKEATEGIGEGAKSADKGVGLLSKGFKGLGTAIKAAGIGLIIAAFAILADVLSENQGVLDFVSTAFETMKGVVRAIVTAVTDAFSAVSELTGGFEGVKAVIGGLITLALAPLKLNFFFLKLALLTLQLAWEKSFLGKGRPKEIKELQASLDETKDKIIEIKDEVITAGKNIGSNFSTAVGEISALTLFASNNITKISIKAIKSQAALLISIQKLAKIFAAQLEGESLDEEKRAEKRRQERDDVSKSIEDRIKANDRLNISLNKIQKIRLESAKGLVEVAKLQDDAIKNDITKLALIEAQNVVKQVELDITGQRSEQLVNQVALEKELIDLGQTSIDVTAENLQAQRESQAELIQLEEDRITKQLENIDIQEQAEKDRLNKLIEQFTVGTQARADAEAELTTVIVDAEIERNELLADEKQLKRDRDLEQAEFDKDNINLTFDEQRVAELDRQAILLSDEKLTLQQKDNLREQFKQSDIARAQAKADAENAIDNARLDNVAAGFRLLGQLAGKNKAVQIAALIGENAAGIAKTVINTVAANTKAVSAFPLTAGQPWVGINTVSAGIGIASSIAATAKGIKALGGGGSAGGGGEASKLKAGTSVAPQFNVVGAGSSNLLAQTISQERQEPIKAFVVSSDITTQQALDRNIEESSVIG